MSNEELEGRIAALEVIAMAALGFCVANTRNDPDYRKAGAIRASMRDALKTPAATLPPAARDHASRYGNHLRGSEEPKGTARGSGSAKLNCVRG